MANRERLETPENQRNQNKYLTYPGKPEIIQDIVAAEQSGIVRVLEDQSLEVDLPNGERVVVDSGHQFNVVGHTISGLLHDLVPGSKLAEDFRHGVLKDYQKAVVGKPSFPMFGTLCYYPQEKDLVLYAPQKWHKAALLARNSLLIRDPDQTIDWESQREKLNNVVIGVAGASVGKNVLLRIVETVLPNHVKISDQSAYKLSNANRTDIAYWELGKNKAVIAARQVHRRDPFINVSVYQEGIHPSNVDDFIGGNKDMDEPAVDVLIEETDDLEMKIRLREEARNRRKMVFMVTDIGSAYQIDFRNFRDYPNLSLAVGIDDEDLYKAREAWQNDKANRESFFRFAFKLIGNFWQDVPEFRDLVLKNLSSPFMGGIPQLGVAANAGASHVALEIAKKTLGHKIQERTFVNLGKNAIRKEGESY